jgi:hypothetical protein
MELRRARGHHQRHYPQVPAGWSLWSDDAPGGGSPEQVGAYAGDHAERSTGTRAREYPAAGRALVKDVTVTAFDPYALLAEGRLGVLATIKADGRPQLSPVTPYYDREAGC